MPIKNVSESEMSLDDRRSAVQAVLNPKQNSGEVSSAWIYVDSLWDDAAVYSKGGKYFKVSYSIDDKGNVTLGTPFEVVRKTTFEPVESKRWVEVNKKKENIVTSSGSVLLEEADAKNSNVFPIKVIQPGWGSSGYYGAEMLKRDGPKVFKSGTHCYWDHPSASQETDRPERSLRDLAGVLASDAEWKDKGIHGPGLYASAKVFEPYVSAVRELAPHIGVSIRAAGVADNGEADGESGLIIEEITDAASVDFVTMPGAGGKVLELFESYRKTDVIERNVEMAEIEDLKEANEKLALENDALAAEKQVIEENLQAAEGILAEQKEAAIISKATAFVEKLLADSELPEPAQKRMVEKLVSARELTKEGELDEAKLATVVETAIADEKAYIESLSPKGIHDMGDADETKPEDGALVKESFKSMYLKQGFSEEAAEKMANIGE